MKPNKNLIYGTAWLAYLAFSLALFPQLNITVMLYSIPLTMVGGWLFSYKGAFLTTLLTIPYHYIMLNIHSDDPQVILEAFNPFGIGTQILFSMFTALLRSSHERYHKLNNSLEELVAERTKDLEELTNYLIDTQHHENRELNNSLLEKPYNELQTMLQSCTALKETLEQENHPQSADASSIHGLINSCLEQLKSMDDFTLTTVPLPDDIYGSLQQLADKVKQFSNAQLVFSDDPVWRRVKEDHAQYLSEIIFEAVGNAIRHADPYRIEIETMLDDEYISVYVINDGIPLSDGGNEGMGLPLMRYRALKMGAEFNLDSLPDGRTQVQCCIPRNQAIAENIGDD